MSWLSGVELIKRKLAVNIISSIGAETSGRQVKSGPYMTGQIVHKYKVDIEERWCGHFSRNWHHQEDFVQFDE